ncbi:DUF2971 domain-containing protein [Sporosarcina psychrophila]|uniref:DUF2971 domain-containing protein n=1 Tax=Sporosarcina psychrophila TaxID=1476 RepID=UPI00078D1040|nr:DUF2971 domain-containing protein [Sporosarcina psychrophila]AMQ06745.1 hypothetical protein AZE41_12825 [Sporosarcina psychrophila]
MDQSTLIWRYMDLSKFIDLLSKKALFFTRSDKFADPFEGATTQSDFESRVKHLEVLNDKPGHKAARIYFNGEWITIGSIEGTNDQEALYKKIREVYFVNCWHMNNIESEAMWKLYLQSGEGIAVQTTVNRLRTNIAAPFDSAVEINPVKYIDYEKERMSHLYGNSTVFFHKRNHFEHEKELRVVTPFIQTKDIGEEFKVIDVEKQSNLYGVHVPINDVNNLIEKVYISPTAPDWFTDVVISILEMYKLVDDDGRVQRPFQSVLKNKPIY